MIAGIGHNGGPELSGQAWRRQCWRRARRDLLPHMPLNVVRRRVRRAAELGLDYKTYATFRATTGRDIIGFLFSSNALGMLTPQSRPADPTRTALEAIRQADLVGLIPARWSAPGGLPLRWSDAPAPMAAWSDGCAAMARARGKIPADGVLLVGAAPWEREWCAAGRLAGYLEADRYFAVS